MPRKKEDRRNVTLHPPDENLSTAGPLEGLKIREGKYVCNNVWGIICHPVEIGLTDLPKSGGAMAAPPGSDSPAQYDPCHLPLVAFLQQLLGPVMSRDFQPFLLSLSRCTT